MDRSTRVVYKKNPLVEVILQIKFPTILSINAKDPADFQDAIRGEYPIYQLAIEQEQEITLPTSNPGSEMLLPSIVQKQQHKNHHFISEDGQYKVNLTSGFISLSTLNYTRWEEMLAHFETPLKKFIEIYHPPFFERIGLRYIDAFSRKQLNLETNEWRDLIQPTWLGAISSINEGQVIGSGLDVEYYLDNGISRVKVHAGLGNVNNNPETVFIVDSDFIHIKNESVTSFDSIVSYLHDQSGQFIRSVITDTLHEAMLPEDLT